MKEGNNLYDALYQSLLTQIYSGFLQNGQMFPSQKELCQQYNVGITTVRKVIRMLEKDRVIHASPGKRAVVCFNESSQSSVLALLKRRDSILDVYHGLEVLMPSLYSEGARRYADPSKLRAAVNIDSGMDRDSIYRRAEAFYTELLQPYRNMIVLDIESELERYVRIPYLPASGLADPLTMAAEAVSSLNRMLSMIEQKRFDEFAARLEQIYIDTGRKVGAYLDGLERMYPSRGERTPYKWFSRKSRSPLYVKVARNLLRRIKSGEFDCRTYLPSVPEIMKFYSISKSTACNTVALLSDIGMIQTIDKKGIVRRESGMLSPIRLERKVIQDNLTYFLDTMQIMTICSKRMFLVTANALDPQNLFELGVDWERRREWQADNIVQALVYFMRYNAPYYCLKNIMEQFDEFLIWGHYLNRLEINSQPDLLLEQKVRYEFDLLCAALKQGNLESFSSAVEAIFKAAYFKGRSQMSDCLLNIDLLPENP